MSDLSKILLSGSTEDAMYPSNRVINHHLFQTCSSCLRNYDYPKVFDAMITIDDKSDYEPMNIKGYIGLTDEPTDLTGLTDMAYVMNRLQFDCPTCRINIMNFYTKCFIDTPDIVKPNYMESVDPEFD